MNKKVIGTAIALSWIVLIVCLIIKSLGGNGFELLDSSDTFSILDTNIIVYTAVCAIWSAIMFTFYYLAICERKCFHLLTHILLIVYFTAIAIAKIYIPTDYYILFDLLSGFIVPFILVFKTNKKYFRIIIAYVLNCGFQAISVAVRNLNPFEIANGSLFVELLLTLDVLIMIVLYYLYTLYKNIKKREVGNNE